MLRKSVLLLAALAALLLLATSVYGQIPDETEESTDYSPDDYVYYFENSPEIDWFEDDDGYLTGILVFREYNWTVVNKLGEEQVVGVRSFNDSIPGPTMRLTRCQEYKIILVNEVVTFGDISQYDCTNCFKEPHFINLHWHGLHVTPIQDDPWVWVEPGQNRSYYLNIPCDHMGGIHLYHAHHHGAVTYHVNTGVAGVVIIEDSDEDSIPDTMFTWHRMRNVTENVLFVHHMLQIVLEVTETLMGDDLYELYGNPDYLINNYLTINGVYCPRIVMVKGVWQRWRIAFLSPSKTNTLSATNCEFQVLAKDGVFLNDIPREVDYLYLGPANRVDAMVRCWDPSYLVSSLEQQPIAYLEMEDNLAFDGPLDSWIPAVPEYLWDLTDDGLEENNLTLTAAHSLYFGDTSINGVEWDYDNDPLFDINLGEVFEWTLNDTNSHPFHQHINHFQIIGTQYEDSALGNDITPDNWYLPGDWADVVTVEDPVVVRFRANDFAGHMTLHCHNSVSSFNYICSKCLH